MSLEAIKDLRHSQTVAKERFLHLLLLLHLRTIVTSFHFLNIFFLSHPFFLSPSFRKKTFKEIDVEVVFDRPILILNGQPDRSQFSLVLSSPNLLSCSAILVHFSFSPYISIFLLHMISSFLVSSSFPFIAQSFSAVIAFSFLLTFSFPVSFYSSVAYSWVHFLSLSQTLIFLFDVFGSQCNSLIVTSTHMC